ncbi:MAG TPA: ABC transporter ATP-binding protein [Candidatus Dormibacteraeota bacterium]|nr:ABC transporter ATP-binding protein [Candidatus Dormibacteraeota bacterium]
MSVRHHPPLLELVGLGKTFGEGPGATQAIAELTFSVQEGELVSVVGPSGCGKTTMLRCVAGLLAPSSGEVRLRGRTVVGPPPEMAFVFQDYSRSLMPWLSVRDNVELPLRHKSRLSRRERRSLVEDAVSSVGLGRFLDRYPWQLSGGMQQRVAIARALAYQPEILLMDEPFASVDAQARADLEDLVLQVQGAYGVTILFVTHDIDEAVYLSDRVVVLTRPPTTVQETVSVELPRPRDQVSTKELPEFARLRAHVFRGIKRQMEVDQGEGAEGHRARLAGHLEASGSTGTPP